MGDSPVASSKYGPSHQCLDTLLLVLQILKKDHKRAKKAEVSGKCTEQELVLDAWRRQ